MQEHGYKPGYFLPYELSDAGSGAPTVRETLVKGWFGALRKIPRLWGDASFLLFESHEKLLLLTSAVGDINRNSGFGDIRDPFKDFLFI